MKQPLSRAEARELDRRAIEEFGIPACVLMENAGRACALELMQWPELAAGACVILCGAGNNGGDGLVIARTLLNHGLPARVLMLGDPEHVQHGSAELQLNLKLWLGLGGALEWVGPGWEPQRSADVFASAGVLVDALFGTGLTRAIGEPAAGLITAMNASKRPILAVDMPSGVDADSGRVLGIAVLARATLSFVGTKRGQMIGQGPRHCGLLKQVEIGIPFRFFRGE